MKQFNLHGNIYPNQDQADTNDDSNLLDQPR